MLLVLQVAIPLLLVLLVAVRGADRSVKLVQLAATVLYLLAVHLAGLWIELPWSTPWLYWLLLAIAAWRGLSGKSGVRPSGIGSRFVLLAWCIAALAPTWIVIESLRAGLTPSETVDLASPLPQGRYVLANGGSRTMTNSHLNTLNPKTDRQRRYRGQSYGVDIISLHSDRRMASGWRPADPARYAIFGTPVLAPCKGVVVDISEGRPDMRVPHVDQEVMTGNHVLLRCRDADVLLAHLRRGTVAVATGQRVTMGQRLGEVGNSGNSDVPHLHLHAQRRGSVGEPFAANPLPVTIEGRFLSRGDRL